MRITNTMMSNTMLMNISRNIRNLDNLLMQQATTKKIQVASDNPILASRALKFRTNVSETLQYQRNVTQGSSWMDVTEVAFSQSIEIMKNIKDRCDQAANGPLEYTDRQKINTDINQLMEHLGTMMNQTYAGRYVFSGYRTDQEALFQKDNSKVYQINQVFNVEDIENCRSYQKVSAIAEPESHEVSILKLPYTGMAGINDITIGGTTYTVVTRSTTVGDADYDTDAYDLSALNPTDNEIVFIKETGELVLPTTAVENFTDGTVVSYVKQGFKQGELNPAVYFTCSELDPNNGNAVLKSYDMNNQLLKYEFSVNTRIQINSLGKDVYTDKLYADLRDLVQLLNNVETSSEEKLRIALDNNPTTANLSDEEKQTMIDDQLVSERQLIQDIIYNKFNNMLKQVDRHFSNMSKEQTDLASRMNRLDLIQGRLEQDEESYTKLLSENEDVDLLEISMLLYNAKSVYEASLKAGLNVIQMTLANYI